MGAGVGLEVDVDVFAGSLCGGDQGQGKGGRCNR